MYSHMVCCKWLLAHAWWFSARCFVLFSLLWCSKWGRWSYSVITVGIQFNNEWNIHEKFSWWWSSWIETNHNVHNANLLYWRLQRPAEKPVVFISYIATDGQSASSSWCRAPFAAGDQMLHFFEWQFLFLFFYVRCPLWREDGSVTCSAMTQVQFQVVLLLTVCRSVRLCAGPPTGPMTRF
jgi:hypothetical protein